MKSATLGHQERTCSYPSSIGSTSGVLDVDAAIGDVRPHALKVTGSIGLTAGSIVFTGGIALTAFPLVR